MFREQERMAYQSIRAPEELREKIMAKKKPTKGLPMYLTTALAACLVLAIGIGLFFPGGNAPGITVNGQPLKDTVVYYDVAAAADMRSTSFLTVPVELELSEESEISVSQGTLTAEDGSPAPQRWASGTVSLLWQLPREQATCKMTITDGRNVTTLTLQYNQSEITITKKGD